MVVTVTVVVTVIIVVTVVVIVVVSFVLHLYFRVARQGKERGLYPPSGWCWRTQGFGAYFKLELENQGVVASF
jgi:hypothetical protein